MIRPSAILLALAPFFAAQAQLPQYHAQVFGAEQGIGAGGIADIFKDQQQFLWVVNLNTLQRFDGRHVRTFQFEQNIRQALCDRDNGIWAIAGTQVWRSRRDAGGFETVPFDTAGGVFPVALFQLTGRPLYILTMKGLYSRRSGGTGFERLPLSPPPPLSYTNLWRFDTCGNTVFYPGKGCLNAYDVAADKAMTLPFQGEIPYFYALTPDLVALTDYSAQTHWFDFARNTVRYIDPVHYGLSAKPSILGITGVAPLGRERFLMTSRIGTVVYDLNKDRFSKERIYAAGKPLDLEDMLVRVFVDARGVVWAHNINNIIAAGSIEQTLGLLRNHQYDSSRAWSNRVVGFTKDNDGNLWFGGGGGFKKLDLRTGKITPYLAAAGATNRLSHASVRGMGFDGKYVVIGPTDKGVWLFDPKTERYRRPAYAGENVRKASEGDFIDHLAVLRNGDVVVAGRFHPYRIEARSYRMDFIRFPGDNSNMNAVLQDKNGRIWLGTHAGVYCFDENYRLISTCPTEPVFCLLDGTGDHDVLVGTNKGLNRVSFQPDRSKMEIIPIPEAGIGVTSLLRDSLQRLWMGTLNGLYLAGPDLKVFKKFDFADNLQGLVFYGSTCIRTDNGMAFFGGANGINYFFPEKIALEDRPLTVSIQSLRINDRDTVQWQYSAGPIRLPFRENTLTFEVAAPYFNNADKVQYRYRLSGHSENWINTGIGNQIRLTNLPAGDYRLTVAAGIAGQTWYEAPQDFVFSILPPFWQTWPFRLALGVLLIGSVFGLIRFRENRLKQRQREALEVEKLKTNALQAQLEAARAKLQSMRLQMNPHFLFNALNSIQQMILSGNDDGAALYLSKFSKLLRTVLTHSDREFVSLREEVDMLKLYLDLESLRFDDTFTYAVDCDEDLDLDEYKVPPLLIQPFVENAIWHGLLHKEGKRALKVHFSSTPGDQLRCTVEDNGIGRAAAGAYARNGAHTGKGMSTGAERIETLNRQYGQHNKLEIIDLCDNDKTPAGTKVEITLA